MKSRVVAIAAVILDVALALPRAAQSQQARETPMVDIRIAIPQSVMAEHDELHEMLERATHAKGAVGDAARELARVLHPHFVREEQIALPPLGLIKPLAEGAHDVGLKDVLALTDSLRAELPRMLREHQVIAAAAHRLEEVATANGDIAARELARRLTLHAETEEDVYYPAAILVGDVARARLSASLRAR